ncbi:MAG: HD domain-containing phosphohydrolase [Vulcanibacillus sp.]
MIVDYFKKRQKELLILILILIVFVTIEAYLFFVLKELLITGIVILFFVIVTIFYILVSIIFQFKGAEEGLLRIIFEQTPLGIAIASNNRIIEINPKFERIVGRPKEELIFLGLEKITHPDDLKEDLYNFNKLTSDKTPNYSTRIRLIKSDQSIIWVRMTVTILHIDKKSDNIHLCIVEDITEQTKVEQNLHESERSKSVLLSNLHGLAYRCNYDSDWTMKIVSEGCLDLTGYKPESLLHNNEVSFNSLIEPEYRDYIFEKWARVIETKGKFKHEYAVRTASGQIKWVFEQGQGIYDNSGNVEALEGLIIDITERKQKEDEISYLNYHDYHTGLFNRRYFDQQKELLDNEEKLPLSVIIGDIDGLKLINDAFGHYEGDKLIIEAAKILKSCFGKDDVIARTGGDEFSILLPNTDSSAAFQIIKQIKKVSEIHNTNSINEICFINISLGYDTKNSSDQNINQIIKNAEDFMYRRKLLENKSSHSNIISSIKATMFERSQETKDHADRLIDFSKRLGRELNLTPIELYELELFATLHDIGKIAINDQILGKPGELTKDEWIEMKKHPEIGYRIAISSHELVPIADYILSHHERWDGNGYPQGLKGEEIPLLARILSVVDAYDAMTQDRVYRKALSETEAIEEIRRNAGTQFDQDIVNVFLEKVLFQHINKH